MGVGRTIWEGIKHEWTETYFCETCGHYEGMHFDHKAECLHSDDEFFGDNGEHIPEKQCDCLKFVRGVSMSAVVTRFKEATKNI